MTQDEWEELGLTADFFAHFHNMRDLRVIPHNGEFYISVGWSGWGRHAIGWFKTREQAEAVAVTLRLLK